MENLWDMDTGMDLLVVKGWLGTMGFRGSKALASVEYITQGSL